MSSSRRRLPFIPGGSEQLNRFKILRRRQKRLDSLNMNNGEEGGNENESSSDSDHSLEADPDYEIQKVVNRVQAFASDLYLVLREQHPTNLVYSPLGFCISSVLIQLGCVGTGEQELRRALFPKASGEGDQEESDDSDSVMVIGLSAIQEFLKGDNSSFTLKHAHKIFMDSNHKPRKTYKNLVSTISSGGVEIEELNFTNLGWEQSTTKINRWAHEAGGKMLGEILSKRCVGPPKLFLVNPLYFVGNWIHPFNPGLTQESKFFVTERDTVNVPMMKSGFLKNLLYSPMNKLGCRAVVLPYKGDRLGLVIFLPNEKGGLASIESNIEYISPANYLHEMQGFRKKMSSKSGIQVKLPKLRFDCTIDYQIPMKELGVETVFLHGKADFSGMAHISAKNLNVTEVLQKVVFDINETGTESPPDRFKNTDAVETAMGDAQAKAKISDDGYSEIIEFNVDHPFYFQLVDMKTDLILLAGTCKNPLHGKDLGFKEFLQKYDIEVTSKLPPTAGEVKTWNGRDK